MFESRVHSKLVTHPIQLHMAGCVMVNWSGPLTEILFLLGKVQLSTEILVFMHTLRKKSVSSLEVCICLSFR